MESTFVKASAFCLPLFGSGSTGLGVEIGNNEYGVLLEKGIPLPAKKMRVYHTTKSLSKGETGEMLSIPVVEGENPKADRNRLQGMLTVKGTDIRRDIPADSEVEVTLMMDEDRCIRARAYITMLDEEFEVVIKPETRTPDASRLKNELREEKKRLGELAKKYGSSPAIQEQEKNIEELEGMVEAAQGDPDAANKAEARILELKADLDRIEIHYKWPEMIEDARQKLDALDNIILQFGNNNPEFKRRAKDLRAEVEQLIEERRDDLLPKKVKQVLLLSNEVWWSNEQNVVRTFMQLKQAKPIMKDQMMASQLINQGDSCMQRGDTQQLLQIEFQLIELLPTDTPPPGPGGGYRPERAGGVH